MHACMYVYVYNSNTLELDFSAFELCTRHNSITFFSIFFPALLSDFFPILMGI
jgi:hypothetical protein